MTILEENNRCAPIRDYGTRLFLFLILWYMDYSTERYDFGTLLDVIIIGQRVDRSCVSSWLLFHGICDAHVSAFVDAIPAIVGAPESAFELLAELSCNKLICDPVMLVRSFKQSFVIA